MQLSDKSDKFFMREFKSFYKALPLNSRVATRSDSVGNPPSELKGPKVFQA